MVWNVFSIKQSHNPFCQSTLLPITTLYHVHIQQQLIKPKKMKKAFLLLFAVLTAMSVSAKKKNDAYLMVYFSDSDHCIHMAVSMDGYSFTAVNDNYPVIAGDTVAEQKGVRDPHIMRAPDGMFYMAATDLHIFAQQAGHRTTQWERDQQEFGWGNNKNLVLLKSKDLIHWEHSLLRVQPMEGFHDIGATWAPQLIWDEQKKAVMIYWTIRRGNGACKLYYAYANKEFTGFATEPTLLFEKTKGDHTALDGDIVKGNDDRYYLHYAAYDEGFSGVMVAVSDNLTGPYAFQPEIIDKEEKACEAPNVWKRYGTDTFVLMYDCFGTSPHNFGFLETTDFKTYTDIGHFNDEGGKMKTTNFTSPKHGAVTAISKKQAQSLLDYWQKNPVHTDHQIRRRRP